MRRKLLLLVIAITASSFAFGQLTEGFETWPPADWTIVQGACSPTNDITQNSDQFYSGSYSARFSSYSSCGSGYDEYLITPELVVTNGDQTISFWYRKYSSGSEVFKVGWSSSGTDVSTDFTWGTEVSDASTTWQQYSKTDLPVGTKYVAIHYYSNYAYYLYIDDVAGPAVFVPSCPAPATLTETNLTSTSVDLGWTAGGTETTWNIEWGLDGFSQGSGTLITGTTTNPHSLSGLTQDTDYQWYVQADCGGGDESAWVGPSDFSTLIACPVPTTLTETNITSTSVDLGWTAGGTETTWNIEWGLDGFTQGSGTLITGTTTNPHALSGLTAATDYDWYIQADCGGDESTWAMGSFTTACATFTPPFIEDYATYLPNCWSEAQGRLVANTTFTSTTSSSWAQDDFANVLANGKSAKLNLYGTSADEWLISPSIDLSGGSYQLEFDLALTDWNGTNSVSLGADDTLAIVISTDDGVTWSKSNILQVWLAASTISNTGEHVTIDLSSYSTTVKIGIYGASTVSNEDNDVFVDNFQVRTPPACPEPSALTTTNIGGYQADLGWTAGGSEPNWNIEWGPQGFTQGSGTMINNTTDNPYTLTGLTPTTAYDWYVQADCDGSRDESPWVMGSFTTTISCPAPTDLVETNINTTSADLGWTAGGTETDWNIEWGETGFTQGSGTLVSLVSNPHSLTGLTANTAYDWYVQADCDGTRDESTWVGPNSFTTACNAFTAPFSDDFEAQTPTTNATWGNCWSATPAGTTSAFRWDIDGSGSTPSSGTGPDGGANSGSNYAYTESTSGSTSDIAELYSPLIDISNLTTPALTFYYHMYGATMGTLHVDVHDGTSWNDDEATIVGQQQTSGGDAWLQQLVDLSSFSGTIQIRFRGEKGTSYTSDMCIDDVVVDEAPSCPAPTAQTVTNITETAADLGWTASGSEPNWNIEWGTTGFTQGSGTLISNTTDNPYSLSGLTSNTSYDWYVQADCDGSRDESPWAGPNTFSTACGIATIPYFENFDGVTTPDFPPCLTIENTNADGEEWETSADGLSSPNAARMTYNSSLAMDDWFFTEGLALTGGVTYEVAFAYAAESYPESLEVDWGNAAVSTSMSGTAIFSEIDFTGGWYAGSGTFTPATTGTYYVGFHGISSANQFYLYVDDIQIIEVVAATTWTGGVDNDWGTSGNWASGLPSSTTDVTIPGGLTNYPTISNATSIGSLLIESGPGGDGSLLNDGLLVVSGNATVQRHITGGKWHDLSASTQGQTVTALYQGGSPDVWLRTYNETTNTRDYITELTDPLDPGAGFEVWVEAGSRFDITVNYTGTLQRDDVSLSTSSTPALSFSGAHPFGYNLVGNPFASPLDWDEGTWNRTNVGTQVWVWDPTAGNWKDKIAGGAGSLTDGIIPMGQGFFIQATAGSPSFTIPMDARIHSGQAYYKATKMDNSSFESISLKVKFSQRNDELNVAFMEKATTSYDDEFDARKMLSIVEDAPAIYSYQAGEMLSTNSLPFLNGEYRTVEVHFIAGVDGEYNFEANLSNLDEANVWLEDRVDGEIIDLRINPDFTFKASSSDDKERFVLHFNPTIMGIENPTDKDLINVYAFDDKLCIRSTGDAANEVKDVWVYDLFGRAAIQTTAPAASFATIPVHNLYGYVVVKIISESGVTTKKVYLK